jgi:hypothetical protein
MSQDAQETGPVRMPGQSAVELPRARSARRTLALAAAGVGVLGIAGVLIAHNVRNADEADAAPIPAAAPIADLQPSAPAPALDTAAASADLALTGAVGPAHSVSISPTGAHVLAVRDRGVDVWTIEGAHTAWLSVDGDRVDGATWSHDGGEVALWGPDGTVRLWNVSTGALIQTVQAGMGFVATVELTADDHAIIIATDGVRRTWDLHSGTVEVKRGGAKASASPAAVEATTPDGTRHAHIDDAGMVRLTAAR